MTIQQYRGFYTKQTFSFALPNGARGSGLTVIVGPNNAGKTTFIEALTYHYFRNNTKKFNDSERHGRRNPVITYITEKGTERITNVNSGSQVEETGDHQDDLKIEFIASRRWWQATYNGVTNSQTYAQQSAISSMRNAGDIGTAQLIASINLNQQQRDRLTELMKKMVPNFTFWTVGTRESGEDYLKYVTGNNVEHAVDMLGDGIISLFRIAAQLVSTLAHTYTLVIDEPELSLHPTAQKALYEVLAEESANRQIILITHSPYFINWEILSEGGKIMRLNKKDDKMCVVSSLKTASNYSTLISDTIADYQKPEFLDTTAKELLFATKILFVEGKEDVGLLRRWFKDNNFVPSFEIFGYGVGGESNMPFFLELARDLGIEKVAALFDANATKYQQCTDDYTSYHITKLPTDDIRDKLNEDGTIRLEGIFDSHGAMKVQYAPAFEQIVKDIETYFQQ